MIFMGITKRAIAVAGTRISPYREISLVNFVLLIIFVRYETRSTLLGAPPIYSPSLNFIILWQPSRQLHGIMQTFCFCSEFTTDNPSCFCCWAAMKSIFWKHKCYLSPDLSWKHICLLLAESLADQIRWKSGELQVKISWMSGEHKVKFKISL